jgi:hypothetical protein
MMTVDTLTVARDQILGHFKTLWDAALTSASISDITIYYDDVLPANLPDTYARVTLRHNIASQKSMGETGNRRFERLGLLMVQLFTPSGEGQVLSDRLVQIVVDIFEGKKVSDSGVWFRNVRWVEVGPEAAWFQVNVIIEFEYDTIK